MKLKQLVDKMMRDRDFYKQLQSDPAAALRSEGATPKPEQIEALKKINYKYLEDVAAAFGYDVT
jgi:hypothetical protein